jgi:hypothetical protein
MHTVKKTKTKNNREMGAVNNIINIEEKGITSEEEEVGESSFTRIRERKRKSIWKKKKKKPKAQQNPPTPHQSWIHLMHMDTSKHRGHPGFIHPLKKSRLWRRSGCNRGSCSGTQETPFFSRTHFHPIERGGQEKKKRNKKEESAVCPQTQQLQTRGLNFKIPTSTLTPPGLRFKKRGGG